MRSQHLAAALVLAGALAASPSPGQIPLPDVRAEFLVNTFTSGSQGFPAMAVSASGVLWVTWEESGEPPFGIKARRFDPSGASLGPELWLNPVPETFDRPRIAATAGGGLVLVWSTGSNLCARRFNGAGAPLGDKIRVSAPEPFGFLASPDVAVFRDGSFAVAWLRSNPQGDTVLVQRFDLQDRSLGSVQEVTASSRQTLRGVRLAAAADGGFLVVWQEIFQGGVDARRYDGPTGAWSGVTRVDGPRASFDTNPAAALASDGTATVVWTSPDEVLARRLSAAGAPVGPEVAVAPNRIDGNVPAVAIDAEGRNLVVWTDWTIQARILGPDLAPSAGPFMISDPAFPATDPVVVTTATGGFAVAWNSGFEFHTPFENPPPIPGRDGSALGIAARIFGPARCAAGSDVLCLGPGGRFQARVDWKNPFNGDAGTGHPRPLTADTGAFWFFGDQNLELMVKVLDGTAVNGHFWVYAGSLSNVEYTLTVTDTLTGAERSYHNPPFQFASRADVDAFPAAPPADTADTATSAASLAATAPLVGCLPVAAGPPTTLCLASGHFTVSVDFTDPRSGLAGQATAVPLTSDTGAFWFFNDSNLELMVKVLDGRAVNGRFWVFFGALSDVDYTITVTRPETGEVKTYHNPKGTLASRADTQAF
ncbi:MAG: hypothetical protein JF614_22825 [Acidobacteria bacterium]|nr:hypothetical protein [Acidobacteriota bacterium]